MPGLTEAERALRAGLPISPACPAPWHNTLNAAMGKKGRIARSKHEPCVCDYALELLTAFKKKRRQYYANLRDRKYALGMTNVDAPLPEGFLRKRGRPATREPANPDKPRTIGVTAEMYDTGVRTPDLSNGACQTTVGILTMDEYRDTPTNPEVKANAKAVCAACPMETHLACRTYAMAAEKPAGVWGGMLAGMTPRERWNAAIASAPRKTSA